MNTAQPPGDTGKKAKVFGVGLPRCGGQTLQAALSTLFKRNVWHSPGNNWHVIDESPCLGAVEVFASPFWLEENYPGSIYIYNYRDIDSWVTSCARNYRRSQQRNWNHPLWRYPLSQFEAYYTEYYDRWLEFTRSISEPIRCFELNIVEQPRWLELCKGLQVTEPDVAFPRVDQHGARKKVKPPLTFNSIPLDLGDVMDTGRGLF